MAKFVVTAAVVSLGGVDYSDEIAEATLSIDVDTPDATNFASGGWTEIAPGGLKSGSLTLRFVKESDLSGLDAALWAALGTSIAFSIKKSSAATDATNPAYTGNVVVSQWMPVAGSVGDVFGGSVTWPVTGAISRATA